MSNVSRHPLNTQFEWKNCTNNLRRLSAEQVHSYNENGYFLLENAFDPEVMAEVAAEIDPYEEEMERFLQSQQDGKYFIARSGEITFTTNLVAKSPKLREFTSGPVFQDIGNDLIGNDVRLYWDQAVYKKPGATSPFPWHQDNGYTFTVPQQYLTCWIALVDATKENGCPWVLPGLHKMGTLEHRTTDLGFVCVEDADEAICVEAPAGSIVVFSSLTPHATGPNTSDGIRKSYIVQYAPDGAEILTTKEDGSIERVMANAPERQYPIWVDGKAPE